MCLTLLQAFYTDPIELSIVDHLPPVPFILQESEEFAPSDIIVVSMIQEINQLL